MAAGGLISVLLCVVDVFSWYHGFRHVDAIGQLFMTDPLFELAIMWVGVSCASLLAAKPD